MSGSPFLKLSVALTSASATGGWEKLSQVAVKGAEYDFLERQPHPKCLAGTRVALLNHIHGLLDGREKSQLVWLHGMAGVGKSAVAFTVAEMARLKLGSQESNQTQLAGSFFFSRKYTTRCTTGYFFATLAYQLARNFPSIREGVNRAILVNPSLLDPDTSLRAQMDELFLQPLRRLRFRLRECLPLVFVIDALDECGSETDIADLISLLGQALRDPDLPVTHMLLSSRSEEHIRKAFQREEVRPLMHEIPVKISGEGFAINISLDGADVDKDIYIFLEHSFRKLQSRSPDFPQPTRDELARLATRAGRRFIVASTMMEFINDVYNDPRERLQLILDLWREPLPRTEAYKFYDSILSTCADPKRAYLLLSSVAALADPLPISDISNLLGPIQGRDVEGVLAQLRSVLDIPTDNSLPVNIYHSSVRDYVSDPLNCNLPQVQDITSPQSLLTHSSFPLMRSTGLLNVPPVWKSGITSFHTHNARLSVNMYPVQELGPAVDESYEFATSLHPLMEYTEGDNVNLRGICDFLSSPDPNVQCVALQLLEHAAEWENTKFTECMSETFGPVAELVLDSQDIQVHCAALDTLKLFLASPRATDIVKSMIPCGVVDVVCTDLNSKEPLVQLASVELLDAASQCEEILVEFVAAVSLISSLLPSMLPTTQVTALRVLEVSVGSRTHELVKVVADTFHYLIQCLSSFEIIVQIAALKVLEVGAGTKNHELARAVKAILPVLAKILSSGETDVRNAARKVLKAGAQLFDAKTISPTLLPESNESQASQPVGQEGGVSVDPIDETSEQFPTRNTINHSKVIAGLIQPNTRAPHGQAPLPRLSSRVSVGQVSIANAPDRTSDNHHSHGRLPASKRVTNPLCIQRTTIIKQSSYPTASGDRGDVYKCTWNRDAGPDEVAVKSPRFPDLSSDQVAKINKSIDHEVHIWAILEHEYILPFYGTVEGFGLFRALVSPWMPNGNLNSYLNSTGVTLATLNTRLRILRQITEGLKYLHDNNVIHGNLTSNNVLIAANGSPRLADFGISNIVMQANPTYSFHTGAVRWVAPELIIVPEGQIIPCGTKSSDIYALGGIMLQVLYGKQPYWWIKNAIHVVSAKYSHLEPINNSIQIQPNHLNFMRRCWSADSKVRPSVDDVLYFLQGL